MSRASPFPLLGLPDTPWLISTEQKISRGGWGGGRVLGGGSIGSGIYPKNIVVNILVN